MKVYSQPRRDVIATVLHYASFEGAQLPSPTRKFRTAWYSTIPGNESVYERAGVIRSADGSRGSLTMIGTVSPTGGNFEEPVTQSTLGTVNTFLELFHDRARKRSYAAIVRFISWSR